MACRFRFPKMVAGELLEARIESIDEHRQAFSKLDNAEI